MKETRNLVYHVQAAYISQQLIKCHFMLSEEVADTIIPLHVITGSDHTSALYGHGNKPVLEKVIMDPEAREFLGRVGESLVMTFWIATWKEPSTSHIASSITT